MATRDDQLTQSLHDEAFEAHPEEAWRTLRDRRPVFLDAIDRVYVLSRHSDVLTAFTDSPTLSNRVYSRTVGKVFGRSMLEMDGREHVQRRKVVAPQMMGGRLANYLPLIESVAEQLAEQAVSSDRFDLVAEVSRKLPSTVIANMLGLPTADLPMFLGWYNAMMAGFWTDAELRRLGREAHLEFQEYLAPIISARAQDPGEDLISRVLHAQVDGERMDRADIGTFISLLLTAGGETTDKAIANMWWLLLTHPDEYQACRHDPERLDLVFSETMRLYPSLLYLGRETLTDIELHGVKIPANAVIRLAVGSANRDERVFSEPDRFWPDRPDLHRGKELRSAQMTDGRAGHLAFGAGAHFCIGYEFARIESIAISRALLARLGPSPSLLSSDRPACRPPSWVIDQLIVERSSDADQAGVAAPISSASANA